METPRERDNKKAGPIYDRLAAHYERALGPLERRWLGRLRAEALGELPPEARLLEVGAGTGLNFAHYPRGARGVASEPRREMLLVARRKTERPPGVRLWQASAEALPFGDDVFDAAFATLVFCSVASPPKAFDELRRVVRTGGRVVLLEHVRPRGLLGYAFDALNLLTVPLFEDHFNRRTAEEAARAGLDVRRVEQRLGGVVQIIVCEVS
ncbi:MAG TPA: methyltransferase domain-containing protein [Pyrinomonadaceae bacterium]|nr:methyltransferase domain-containing protein [Pyrinomonadaceae bacterium]